MKFLMSILLVGLLSSISSFAAEVTVGKVSKSGKKAVIYIPEGMTLEKGQTLMIGGGETSAPVKEMLPSGVSARSKAIGGNFSFLSETREETVAGGTATSDDKTTIELGVNYIKNNINFEYGGGLTYSSSSTSTVKDSSYGLLGLFEYNFMPNKPGATLVAHLGGQIGYVSRSNETNSGVITDASGLQYGIYGGVKYFMFPTSGFAIVADVVYLIDNSFSQDNVDISISRLGLRAGVRYYF